MPPLVGGIDSAKSRAQCEFGERWSPLLFPRSAVKKIGDGRSGISHRAILTRRKPAWPARNAASGDIPPIGSRGKSTHVSLIAQTFISQPNTLEAASNICHY